MSESKRSKKQKEAGVLAIDNIHMQMETNAYYPYNLQSGWLPEPGSDSMQEFFKTVLEAEPAAYAESIQALDDFIEKNHVITYLVDNACDENGNIIDSYLTSDQRDGVPVPRIKDKKALLDGLNHLITIAPHFIKNDLVGVPMSAFIVGIDPTLSGTALFRLPMFNDHMKKVLDEWNKFLETKASAEGFTEEGKQWLSPAAKHHYDFPMWKKDNETLPYWNSWNSFFTRQFEHPEKDRPIADPDSNRIVNCPNDGSLYKWEEKISEKDVFWFKDMQYSLSDILSSPIPEQQAVIDEHKLVEKFTGGYIFQTYLNPYNYHRWWAPVNGTVLFDPIAIPGCFFSKLVIPDFGGATTASTPYLAQVNARGLIVFETKDYGYVCCIPLGMSEISTVHFHKHKMKQGTKVNKGDEMGKFMYGGSSFAILFQNIPGQKLIFENDKGEEYSKRPILPSGSAGAGGNVTLIGSKIGVWKPYIDMRGVWNLTVGDADSATMTIVQTISDDIGESYTGTLSWNSNPAQYDFFTATIHNEEITIVRSVNDNPAVSPESTQTYVGKIQNETTITGISCSGIGLASGTKWSATKL